MAKALIVLDEAASLEHLISNIFIINSAIVADPVFVTFVFLGSNDSNIAESGHVVTGFHTDENVLLDLKTDIEVEFSAGILLIDSVLNSKANASFGAAHVRRLN